MQNCHARGLTSDNPRLFPPSFTGRPPLKTLLMGKASETQETSRDKVNHMPLPDVSTGIKGKEVKGQRHSGLSDRQKSFASTILKGVLGHK